MMAPKTRRIGTGRWVPVAYRPRRSRGHARNPQAWVDFVAPVETALRYRVAAIGPVNVNASIREAEAQIVLPRPRPH